MVPAFSAWLRIPLKETIATSLACVGVFAIPGTITHALLGHIDWAFAIPLCDRCDPGRADRRELHDRAPSDRTLRLSVGGALGDHRGDLRGRRARRTARSELERRARRAANTASSIGGVSLPVNVFCWLGWNAPTTVTRPHAHFEAVREPRPARRELDRVARRKHAPQRFVAEGAEHDDDAHALEELELAHEVRAAFVALGGRRLVRGRRATHRGRDVHVAQLRDRRRAAPSVGWFAKPVRWSDAKRKSPDRSPVKMRPVRLPPCAAGASPTTSTRALRVTETRHRAGPSTSRRGRRRASRARPPRATRRAADMPDTPLISAASASRSGPTPGTGIGPIVRVPCDLRCGCSCSSTPRRRRSRPAVAC